MNKVTQSISRIEFGSEVRADAVYAAYIRTRSSRYFQRAILERRRVYGAVFAGRHGDGYTFGTIGKGDFKCTEDGKVCEITKANRDVSTPSSFDYTRSISRIQFGNETMRVRSVHKYMRIRNCRNFRRGVLERRWVYAYNIKEIRAKWSQIDDATREKAIENLQSGKFFENTINEFTDALGVSRIPPITFIPYFAYSLRKVSY